MPKIRKTNFRINNGDAIEYFETDMMYSTQRGFYVVLPSKYTDTIHSMDEREMDKIGIVLTSRHSDNIKKYGVTGDSEEACENKVREVVKQLMSSTVEKRDVIVIDFDGHDCGYNSNKREYDKPVTRLEFGLLYCTE